MKQHFCQGENYILVTPGNYGADYLREHMTIPFENNIKCSNYVGETIDMAIDMGVKGILFVAHIGKFVKVAAGIMNTHSHCADGRMEVLCASAIRAGGTLECAREILEAGTTDEALAVIDRYGILEETMAIVMEKIQFYLDHRSYEQILLGAVVFSNVYGLLGQTRDALKLMEAIQEQADAKTTNCENRIKEVLCGVAKSNKQGRNLTIKNKQQEEIKMAGKLYGIGVGPGDPELLTLKALRLVKEADVVALPGKVPEDTVAFKIVEGAYPELGKKELLAVPFPMSKDPVVLKSYHDEGAEKVKAVLDQGKNVAFLTLGDPTVYSTYLYVHHRLVAQGYETEIVCGITSFCAVSARLNTGLVEKAEPLHVIPASYQIEDALKLPGTKVLMKAGKKMKDVKS